MTLLRNSRTLTSLVVAGLAAATMPSAFSLLSFAWNESGVSKQNVEQRLRPFVDRPMVGSLARQEIVRLAPVEDFVQSTGDTAALLAATPLDSGAWLLMAKLKYEIGTPQEVAADLALSGVTGRNEADQMLNRAAFALPLWDKLPPDLRRASIADLVGVAPSMSFTNRTAFTEYLAAKLAKTPAKTRAEIRAALLLNTAGEAIADVVVPAPDPKPEAPPSARDRWGDPRPTGPLVPGLLPGGATGQPLENKPAARDLGGFRPSQ